MPRNSIPLVRDVISILTDSPTPRQYRGNAKDRASKQLESPPLRAQLKSQSPDGKHPQQIFATPKATSYGPEPQIPHTYTRPHSATRRQPPTAAGWRPKTPHGNARSPSLSLRRSPHDLSDSDEGIRKRTRTKG